MYLWATDGETEVSIAIAQSNTRLRPEKAPLVGAFLILCVSFWPRAEISPAVA